MLVHTHTGLGCDCSVSPPDSRKYIASEGENHAGFENALLVYSDLSGKLCLWAHTFRLTSGN
jgi:hypothetical protein